MDIITSIYSGASRTKTTFSEILPYEPPNNKLYCGSSLLLRKKPAIDNKDALHAVQRDPAVLEVQVRSAVSNSGRQETTASQDKAVVPKIGGCSPKSPSFEEMMLMQRAAILSLSPQQMELLMRFAGTLRRQRLANQINLECAFCKNNGEAVSWYSQHALKDWRGRVLCPVLRALRCPRCGATGDRAHTIKYCREYGHARDHWIQH